MRLADERRASGGHLPASRAASVASGLVRAARPRQWLKNVLVFAAPGAAGVLFHGDVLWRVVVAFVAFCLAASGLYLLNDIADIEADRRHPRKRDRPIAAGIVPVATARTTSYVVLGMALAVSALAGRWWLVAVVAIYIALTLAYSLRLKHVAVVDLVVVALGFVVRCYAGGAAARVPLSNWFVIFTSFCSLYVVTGKRLAELGELDDAGQHVGEVRPTLESYRPAFLRMVLGVALAVAVVAYCLWAFEKVRTSRHQSYLFELSVVPMITALLRYGLLVDHGEGSAPEDLFLSDRTLQVLGVAWVVLFAFGVHNA